MIKILLVLSIATLFFGCVGSTATKVAEGVVVRSYFLNFNQSASASQTKAFWKEQSPIQLLDWKMYHASPSIQKSKMVLRNNVNESVMLRKIQVITGYAKYDLFNKTTAEVDKTKYNLKLSSNESMGIGILIKSHDIITIYLNQSAVNKYLCPRVNKHYAVHIDFVYVINGIAQVEGDASSPQIVGVCQ